VGDKIMGSWGPGIFDGDTPMDIITAHIDKCFGVVSDHVKSLDLDDWKKTNYLLYGSKDDEAMVSLTLLVSFLEFERGNRDSDLCGGLTFIPTKLLGLSSPKRKFLLNNWCEKWKIAWIKHGPGSNYYCQERAKVIQAIFDKLIEVTKNE
jgi:hypothetical protein